MEPSASFKGSSGTFHPVNPSPLYPRGSSADVSANGQQLRERSLLTAMAGLPQCHVLGASPKSRVHSPKETEAMFDLEMDDVDPFPHPFEFSPCL